MEFERVLAQARDGAQRIGGIGVLGEKTLHATLKVWLDDDLTHHERPLPEGYVADIFDGERVTEIQTAGFSALRKKLAVLLGHYPVTVVHPLVRQKWVRWINPATGEVSPAHRSPRRGSFTDAGKQMVYILPLLGHPNLTIKLVLLDVEEQRLLDGWGNGGKRGSHRADRLPLALVDTLTLSKGSDYAALLPQGLSCPFTAEDFSKAARMQGRNLHGTLKVLLSVGVLRREKDGRRYLYYKI